MTLRKNMKTSFQYTVSSICNIDKIKKIHEKCTDNQMEINTMEIEISELNAQLSKMNQLLALKSKELKPLSQPSLEKDKKDYCKDCLSKTNIKAELKCGHSICKSCIVRGLMEKFCGEYSYNYKAFCKKCNTLANISLLFFN